MDIGQAFSLRHVGAITGATVIEKPTADGSVWLVEFIISKPLPAHLSKWLEIARGGQKIFKGVQAALSDIKSIGIAKATVQFTAADSFRANRFEWLYEWIRSLYQQGYDEEKILEAFALNPATRLQHDDEKAVHLAKIIIRHALGQSDGKELEAYLPPVEVLDVKYLKPTNDGHLCLAVCPDSKDDFKFLVSLDVPEKRLKNLLADRKAAMCKFVLVAAHKRNPQGYTDPDNPAPMTGVYSPPVAAFRLDSYDIDYLRELIPGSENIVEFPYSGITLTTSHLTDRETATVLSRSLGHTKVFHSRDENITRITFDLSSVLKMDLQQFQDDLTEIVKGFGYKVTSFDLHYKKEAN